MNTLNHYENHLHKYYTWIAGGLESGISKSNQFFTEHNITPSLTKTALDLGAGSGIQSIPLAKFGYKVYAIDFSKKLLAELQENAQNTDITIVKDDILNFDKYAGYNPELIICMGDTLTHLPDIASVEKLILNSYKELITGGKLILTFRDLTFELTGADRFIPVKSTSDTIFTCFLEYKEETVNIFDIVHKKTGENWKQKISTYQKIKIGEDKMKETLSKAKFKIEYYAKKQGLITVIAVK
jgi:SAM-dependent methyltransferase